MTSIKASALQLHAETDSSVLNIVKDKEVYKRARLSSPKVLDVFDCDAGCIQHIQLHSQSRKQVSCENMAVFQTLLPLKWQAALALKNLSNSSIVIVLCFSVVIPFLFLCLAILVYFFA